MSRGIAETKTRLVTEFREHLRADVIHELVDETFTTLQDSAIREYVPLFVYRAARERLLKLARAGAV